MKKTALIMLAALATTAAVAGPALAQPYGEHRFEQPGAWDLQRRIDWTQDRIIRGRDSGQLDRREFYRVQSELNRIRREREGAFRHFGALPPRVRDDLTARLDILNDQIHWLSANNERHPW
jgi:hypothetical protein